ncbi:nucleotidyltransferase domain-containing protein [Alicyclobacillus macrosporangiidus]|uniref:nucleotidyltransferase domain-containing protein n=1 Tax=Alicyclobacillus macrosporangiidus TaxID=392015 RepID=UPI0009DDF4E8|nr:hypothetical protein [Alicyclobacillus macrosporangiidus]MCL6599851.1 hypothetical protein [Alicyclobacillus macrosporangiidus]
MDFTPLAEITRVMETFGRPWFIVGGWALDLSLGHVTREHHDVDVCVFRDDVASLLSYFQGWDCKVVIPGEHRLVTCSSERDTLPPRHELHFSKAGTQIEVLLIDKVGDRVLFRRDPTVWMAYERFSRRDLSGRPFVAREWQLLFKAKSPRSKDELDFRNHAPNLEAGAKKWLVEALKRHVPYTTWIEQLQKMMESPIYKMGGNDKGGYPRAHAENSD